MNKEQQFITNLAKIHKRSDLQLNQIHETDAELIQIAPSGPILAITTDTLVEEISELLYTDPFFIGWMVVTCNASDIAAVGARPLGILISQTLPENYPFIAEIQVGIKQACDFYNLPLLGGDTNFSKEMSLTGTAVGIVSEGKSLTRKGCTPDDILVSSGPLGSGNLFAYQTLIQKKSSQLSTYRPTARIREGQLLRSFASCCIDTSDGLFSSLEDLMGVNSVGFQIDSPLNTILSNDLQNEVISLPEWLFLAGHHGEYELIFSINPLQWNEFLDESKKIDWKPIRLGQVVKTPGIHFNKLSLAPGAIRKTWSEADGNIANYIKLLIELERS